ncbi:MAG TPA: hypothetical protein VM285_02995 [Polyangia bacterium]|nr:hypothetical protein [Thermoleophilia bacterium]HUT76623.1 hypothetical protein [Polyangia bacterium]
MAIVKLAGCWDTIWLPSPAVEYDSRWRFLVIGYKLAGIYMSPVTGLDQSFRTPANPSELVIEVADIAEAIAANPTLVPVLVDESSPNPLRTFEHPTNVLYLFGRTGLSFLDGWQGLSVAVEAPGQLSAWLQPDQAAAIVLYDRMVKSWL